MLKLLACTAAALFAIVQIEPSLAQSAPPAEKAVPAATDAAAEKAADKPAVDKPAAEKSAAEKPAAERSGADKAATEKPAADKAAAEKPADKEAVRSPAKPVAEKPVDEDKPAKKKTKKLTRQQELDRSIETGTVPARYRSQVPKEYHQFIPFARQ